MRNRIVSLVLLLVAVGCAVVAWQNLRPRTYDAPLPAQTFAPPKATPRPSGPATHTAPQTPAPKPRPGTDFGEADPCLGKEPTEADAKADRRCTPAPARSRLRIPSLGINAGLVDGKVENHELFLPYSIYDVAVGNTYAGLDGTTGTVLMSGHVGAGSVPGSLHPLSRIQRGALIETTSRKGTTQQWSVVGLQRVPFDQLTVDGNAYTPDRKLVLITCGGKWSVHNGKRTYAERVVVTAVPKA